MTTWNASARQALREADGSERTVAVRGIMGDEDNRRWVANGLDPDSSPWSTICQLDVEFPFGSDRGTGWMIGSAAVATAGHCVFSHGLGGWAKRIRVRLPRGGDVSGSPAHRARAWDTTRAWVEHPDPISSIRHDYGVVWLRAEDAVAGVRELREEGGDEHDEAPDADELRAQPVFVAGYPSPPPSHLPGFGKLVYHGQPPRSVTDTTVAYTIDTSPGQSGAPVLRWDGSRHRPVGIHLEQRGGRNFALRLVPPVRRLLRRWASEGPP